MATLNVLGYFGNEPDRLACALHELRGTLAAPAGADGFGLAHFTDDRLLLNKRPTPVAPGLPLDELVGPVRTTALLLGMHSADDDGPFKFRSWAFAMHGAAGRQGQRGELRDKLPDFLARNVAGDSLAEAAFHRFLAALHQHSKVDDIGVDGRLVAQALRSTLEAAAGTAAAEQPLVLMATNGRVLVCAHKCRGMAYSLREGILDCGRCKPDRHTLDTFPVRESHRRFKGVLVAAGLPDTPAGFLEVPDGKTVVVNRRLDVQVV